MSPWYEETFGRDYLALYPHRDNAEARRDIERIVSLIDPQRDRPLLDLGCGPGRHLVALHEAGFTRLTGLDLSQELLDVARERLDAAGCTEAELVRADMREIPFRERFATVLSMFTSFGYFPSEEDDQTMLRGVFAALAPGGVLVLDTLHRGATIAGLVPEEKRTIGGHHVHIRRSITPDGKRVEKTTQLVMPGEPDRVYRESVRMYSGDDLRALAAGAGFSDIALYGTLDGSAFGPTAPRSVIVARRPDR